MVDKTKGNTKHPIPVQKIKAETEKAWLIQFDDGQEHWLPKSQCWIQVMVPEWLIEQKQLQTMKVPAAPAHKHIDYRDHDPYSGREPIQAPVWDDDDKPF